MGRFFVCRHCVGSTLNSKLMWKRISARPRSVSNTAISAPQRLWLGQETRGENALLLEADNTEATAKVEAELRFAGSGRLVELSHSRCESVHKNPVPARLCINASSF